jgi:hypothetical protein
MITGAKKMNNKSTKLSSSKGATTTFTYFIPAPPSRKTGYREREFDKIMAGILESGFELLSLQTQSVGNTGLFIIAVLKSNSKKTSSLDVGQDIHERFKLAHSYSSPDLILDENESENKDA